MPWPPPCALRSRAPRSGRENSVTTGGGVAFDGEAVVVTGVGRLGQVGETVARAFARSGAAVHCVGRDAAVLDRVAELRAAGHVAEAHRVDLTAFDEVRALGERIATAHGGRIAAVAAIAGGFAVSGPLAQSDPAVYANQIAINLTTAYATARAFLPGVRAARGAFVFVSSANTMPAGRVAGIAAYAMAKGAVIQLVRALAQEERDTGVRANAIAPASIRTATNEAAMGTTMRYVEREEVAATVLALCGPGFTRVSGQVIELA